LDLDHNSSDFTYGIATLETTPLVAASGLGLTIPIVVAGAFLLGRTVTSMSLLGALLVLCSFVVVGPRDQRTERFLPRKQRLRRSGV
jgi:solute carrier family 35 protein F5